MNVSKHTALTLLLFFSRFMQLCVADCTERGGGGPQLRITPSFKSSPFGVLVNGERNKIMLSIKNVGNSDIYIQSIDSCLVDATNFTRVIRKMTANKFKGDGHHIPPNHRANLTTKFFTEYETGEYGMTMHLNVNWKNNTRLRILGLEQTIMILDPAPSFLDSQTISLYITMIAGLIGLFYLFKAIANPTSTRKHQPKSRSTRARKSRSDKH